MTVYHDCATLNELQKLELVKTIWNDPVIKESEFKETEYVAFFHYVHDELKLLERYRSSFAAQTCDSIIDLVRILRQNRYASRSAIADSYVADGQDKQGGEDVDDLLFTSFVVQ